jgi:hypothetical protein
MEQGQEDGLPKKGSFRCSDRYVEQAGAKATKRVLWDNPPFISLIAPPCPWTELLHGILLGYWWRLRSGFWAGNPFMEYSPFLS